MTTIQNTQPSKPGNVSETQRLTAKSDRLSSAVDSWNSWYVGLGLLALLVAFGVFFAQWRIIRKSKELSLVQSDLIAAKDRQAAADSKDQDERIAAAQNKAAESNEAAGKANERAGKAELAASKAQENLAAANERAAHAEKGAAEASAKAEGFRLDIARANERAASANETAERERLARLQLEARLADRVLSPFTLAALTEFAKSYPDGLEIDICTIGGTLEVANLSDSIRLALSNGGWKPFVWQIMGGAAARGVLVATNPAADKSGGTTASKLVEIINTSGPIAGPWDFKQLETAWNSGIRNGPVHGLDGPVLIFIGPK